jgi:peptidoglycan/LPS O-acetylase OafA/YrhL
MKTSTDTRRLSWLDRVRGISIVWIFLVHFIERFMAGSYFGNPDNSWPALAERIAQLRLLPVFGVKGVFINALRYTGWLGDQGVQILLVASGFGLAYAALKDGGKLNLKEFFSRRFVRILPLWWAVHIVFILTDFFVSKGLSYSDWRTWASLFGFRFFPQVFYYFSPAWWYIGLLLQLYLLFPFLYRILRKAGPVRFFLMTAGLSVILRAVGLVAFRLYLDWWSRGAIFITRLPEFAFGMAFAGFYSSDPQKVFRWVRRPSKILLWIVMYLLGILLSFTLLGMSVSFLLTGAAGFLIMFSMFAGVSWPSFGPVAWLGRHSYSIFLMHHPVILFIVPGVFAFDGSGRILVFLILAFAASVVGAVLLEALTAGLLSFWKKLRKSLGAISALTRVVLTLSLGYALLVSMELIIRVAAPQEILGWGERESLEPDQESGYRLKPDRVTRLRWQSYDYVVTANALGFPGPLYSTVKPEGTYRIFVTGDAFESAEGVDTPKAWPRLLEAYLNGNGNRSSSHFEVQNFSITGWGPNQYEAVVKKYAPQYSPDLIIIGFFVNDYFDVRTTNDEFRISIGFTQPSQNGARSYLGLKHLREWIQQYIIGRVKELLSGDPYSPGYFLGNFQALERSNTNIMQENAEYVEQRLRSIRSTADEIGAKVILVMVPAPVQVDGPGSLRYYPKRIDLSDEERFDLEQPQRLTRNLCNEIGIDCLDLRPPLISAVASAPYQPRNMHFTECGHDVVARYVAAELSSRGYLR